MEEHFGLRLCERRSSEVRAAWHGGADRSAAWTEVTCRRSSQRAVFHYFIGCIQNILEHGRIRSGLDNGYRHGRAVDALNPGRIGPSTSSWLDHGCFELRASSGPDRPRTSSWPGHGCSELETDTGCVRLCATGVAFARGKIYSRKESRREGNAAEKTFRIPVVSGGRQRFVQPGAVARTGRLPGRR